MMSWWSRIDTAGYDADGKSLYEQLFLDKTVVKLLPGEAPGVFALKSDGTELLDATRKIANHIRHCWRRCGWARRTCRCSSQPSSPTPMG